MAEDAFDVQRITIRPGDILAVRVKGRLTGEMHDRIREVMLTALDKAGHPDTPVIVTPEEIGFAVIEKEPT